MTEKERIKILNNSQPFSKGKYVLYMMQSSQRVEENPALNFAIEKANELNIPLITAFAIMPSYPGANLRHYAFMIEGLIELHKNFLSRGLNFFVFLGTYEEVCLMLSKDAAMIVTDWGYMPFQKKMRQKVAMSCGKTFIAAESDVVVPVQIASSKKEPYAMSFRPKIIKQIPKYLKKSPLPELRNKKIFSPIKGSIDLSNPEKIFKMLKCPSEPGSCRFLKGGRKEALIKLNKFINEKLPFYDRRSDPAYDFSSGLSPYLHFGQISPIEIALSVIEAENVPLSLKEKFLDQLIVWRELARNFLSFEENFDSLKCLPRWAQEEIKKHSSDIRPVIYTLETLENAQTKDRWWNIAQKELIFTGRIHNYMRMYWGKKIIEWSPSFERALEILIYLNDKYAIDGRDPNGYASILWCFGLHDRPFFERPIFGKIRYMSSAGLERKFEMEKYYLRISSIIGS
ncbi:MAG: deoxyribodipyrimidine photo-lyase [Elusimicrobiota bacterium]